MTKEQAALLAKKQNERRIDLGRLTSYPEYYALKEEMEKLIAELDTIDSVDLESKVPLDVQVKAHKFAKEKIKNFLSTMNVYQVKGIDTKENTYE